MGGRGRGRDDGAETLETCAASQIQQVMHPTSTAECGAVSACGRVSPHLALAISPQRGPTGTRVTVTVNGCNDPHGDNHTITFESEGVAAAMPIESNAVGQTLTATFRIPRTTRRSGTFTAQCSESLVQRRFTLIGR